MANWFYQDKKITSIEDCPKDAVGFVYMLLLVTGEWYIGRKMLFSTVTRPPLKGEKKKRKITKVSNFLTYKSSHKDIKNCDEWEIQKRIIIDWGMSKKHTTYLESHALFVMNALTNPLCLNGNIQGKFFPADIPGNEKIK